MNRYMIFLGLCCLILLYPIHVQAESKESISLTEAEDAMDKMTDKDNLFSISDYVKNIQEGKVTFSFSDLGKRILSSVSEQFMKQRNIIFRILALGILSGIFFNFAGTVGGKDLSDTGFYVTYLLLFATVVTGFHTVSAVAEDALSNLLIFMKALIPSFSLSLCFTANTSSSIAFYETMLIGISVMESIMLHVFLPGVKVFFLVGLLNPLIDNRFSRMAELVHSFLKWTLKILFGILIGYQGIQGLLMPVMDKVKNNALLQSAKGMPGVGNTVGSVADTVLGSGMLIKSAIGVGGIICICVLCLYPLIQLIFFALIYRICGAVVQPVSDKRLINAIQTVAVSGRLLAGFVFAGALMFILSITIVLVSTNAVN